jgi:hypothetical protein
MIFSSLRTRGAAKGCGEIPGRRRRLVPATPLTWRSAALKTSDGKSARRAPSGISKVVRGPIFRINDTGPPSFQQQEETPMIRLPKWFVMVLALVMMVGLTGTLFAADTAKGKIKSVNADKKEFVLTDTNDKDWTFQMDAAGKIKLADKEVKLDELKKGDQVEIKYEKDGDKLIAKEITVKRE